MRPTLNILVWASLGFMALSGGLALLAPLIWTTLFGLQTTDPQALAFARVAGVREVILITVTIILMRKWGARVATVAIGFSMLIGVADFTVVFGLRGPSAKVNLAVHAGSLLLLFVTWLGLRRDA